MAGKSSGSGGERSGPGIREERGGWAGTRRGRRARPSFAPRAVRGRKKTLRPPQQARSRKTRERVVKAAVECFERHGFEETTTAMIARRAGVAVGSVYNYFHDKRALILELLDETHRTLADQIIAGLDPDRWRGRKDPREHVRQLIDAIFHSQSLRPGIQRILWARYFKDPDFAAPFEAIRDRLIEAVVDFLDAVGEQGLVRPGLDRSVAPFVIVNAVQWNASQAFFQGDPRFRDRAARATAELVSTYVFGEVSRTRRRVPSARGRSARRSRSR